MIIIIYILQVEYKMNKKQKQNEQYELHEISSNASSVKHSPHGQQNVLANEHDGDNQLNDQHPQNVPLANNLTNSNSNQPGPQQGQPNNAVVVHSHRWWANKTKILKFVMGLLIMTFVIWIATRFLSQNFTKSRQPMFLSSFGTSASIEEVMSPQQTDYKAFKYYQRIMQLAKITAIQKRGLTPQQMKQFDHINFKQFYSLYKVIRTIQLAEQFTRTPIQQDQLNIIIDQSDINQPINKTQYFFDAVDQFSCASCYSFPIAATVEYLYKYKYNISIKLSEQQLIDCAHDITQPNGCDDGNITRGFEYVRDVGLVSTDQYPYRSISGESFRCDKETIQKNTKYKISGFKMLPPGNCQAIQSQIVKGNVVAAMIHAGQLNQYTGGTFTDCKRFGLNHAITIVGQTQKNQWIVRNSWGKSWGNYGYFVMGHGNTCGVCSHAIVPVLNIQNGQIKPYNPKDDQTKDKKDK